jgi:integrase
LENRQRAKIDQHTAAALRLLMFTGARLREVLHLKWADVDVERGILLLEKSKTGKKTIILNAPALKVLASLPQTGTYVFPGDAESKPKKWRAADETAERPRDNLKHAWKSIRRRAGIEGVRIHDLRHTFASVGAGASLGLPIVGKLLGHTQSKTTERYAHLDNDPLRRAAETIGKQLAASLDGTDGAEVISLDAVRATA